VKVELYRISISYALSLCWQLCWYYVSMLFCIIQMYLVYIIVNLAKSLVYLYVYAFYVVDLLELILFVQMKNCVPTTLNRDTFDNRIINRLQVELEEVLLLLCYI